MTFAELFSVLEPLGLHNHMSIFLSCMLKLLRCSILQGVFSVIQVGRTWSSSRDWPCAKRVGPISLLQLVLELLKSVDT